MPYRHAASDGGAGVCSVETHTQDKDKRSNTRIARGVCVWMHSQAWRRTMQQCDTSLAGWCRGMSVVTAAPHTQAREATQGSHGACVCWMRSQAWRRTMQQCDTSLAGWCRGMPVVNAAPHTQDKDKRSNTRIARGVCVLDALASLEAHDAAV
jgi:hypothetical protein